MSDFACKRNSTSDLRFHQPNVWRGCGIALLTRFTREELSFAIDINLQYIFLSIQSIYLSVYLSIYLNMYVYIYIYISVIVACMCVCSIKIVASIFLLQKLGWWIGKRCMIPTCPCLRLAMLGHSAI